MEQIKIFTQGTEDEFNELEEKANKWLKENDTIKIVARQTKVVTLVNREGNPVINCTIVIFYTPAE